MITINKIIDGICMALNDEFPDYEIYTEHMEQGINEPCFFVRSLDPMLEPYLGNRYLRIMPFCIHYFPSTDEKRAEMNDITETLLGIMEYITVDGDLVLGTKMSSRIEDDVLLFFVNYDRFVYREIIKEDPMEYLDLKTKAESDGLEGTIHSIDGEKHG